jgi:hypothetical protein
MSPFPDIPYAVWALMLYDSDHVSCVLGGKGICNPAYCGNVIVCQSAANDQNPINFPFFGVRSTDVAKLFRLNSVF